MGASQGFVRSDAGDADKGRAAPQAAATQITGFPPLPDPYLNTSTRQTPDGVKIKGFPIEVKHTEQVIPNPDVINTRRSYYGAVNEVLTKLDEYAKANGAQVEPSSVRSSTTGPISWLLTRKGVAEWVRRTFPVEAHDLTRVEADGTARKVCQVRISKGFFSGKAHVTVPRYPGGETEGDRVEIALGLKTTPGEGVAPTGAPISAAPDFKSTLEAQIAHQHAAKQEEQRTRKRLGLTPKASVWDIQEMKRLVGEIERDVKDLLNDPANRSEVTKKVDGSYEVLRGHYKIDKPEALKTLEKALDPIHHSMATIMLAGSLTGIALATSLGVMLVPPGIAHYVVASLGGMGVALVGGLAAVDSYIIARHRHYLRGSLQSKEPGSLGAVVDSFHKAGLDCDIRVGAWYRKEMRVDLRVSYTPKKDA